jgi:WD40 repeat protein
MMTLRRLLIISGLLSVLLSGCGTSGTEAPTANPEPATPPSRTVMAAWQPAGAPLTVENVGQIQRLGTLEFPDEPASTVFSFAVALNQTEIAAINSNSVMLWDLFSGTLRFSTLSQDATQVFFAPDRASLYTLTADGLLRKIDTASGDVTQITPLTESAGIHSAYDPLNGWLAVDMPNGDWVLWDVPGNLRMGLQTGTGAPIQAMAFDSARSRFAVADRNGTVEVWDIPSLVRLWRADLLSPISRTAFTEAGLLLVKADDGVLLMEAGDGTVIAPVSGPVGSIFGLLAQADTLLMSSSDDTTLQSYDLIRGGIPLTLALENTERLSAEENADGTLMLTAAPGTIPTLWKHLPTGGWEVMQQIEVGAPVIRTAWTADGYQIVLFRVDGQAEVWGIAAR